MVSTATEKRKYTYEDYLKTPDDVRYELIGVKEFWIVIPDEESIEVYILKGNTFLLINTYYKNEILESPHLKGFKIELKGEKNK